MWDEWLSWDPIHPYQTRPLNSITNDNDTTHLSRERPLPLPWTPHSYFSLILYLMLLSKDHWHLTKGVVICLMVLTVLPLFKLCIFPPLKKTKTKNLNKHVFHLLRNNRKACLFQIICGLAHKIRPSAPCHHSPSRILPGSRARAGGGGSVRSRDCLMNQVQLLTVGS